MSSHPSPLADKVVHPRLATLATPAHAWVPQAIHALILACLARLFGRLEEMIRLWQAGLLPAPIQRPSTPRTPSARPGPREARQDSDSVRYLAHYAAAARSATAHARTSERAEEAGVHMETERRREAGEARPSCFSPSLRLHVQLLPPPRAYNAPANRPPAPSPTSPIACRAQERLLPKNALLAKRPVTLIILRSRN